MKYLIKVKIILLLLSIIFLTNSCVEMYCVLSDSDSNFCGDVLMKANERREKRYEKEKMKEQRKKLKKVVQNKEMD
ncbi:MAG: hypothetical protein Q4A77_06630 [Leptotrichia hongkongensis]|nr:hypothetical protein [Leptotrichia hongkongensis]